MKINEVTQKVVEDELKINYNRLLNRLEQKSKAGDKEASSIKNRIIQQWENNELSLKRVKKLLNQL